MSTRCQLIIWDYVPETDDFERRLNFYHHCDGYLSYIETAVKDILKTVKDFKMETLESAFVTHDSFEKEEPWVVHGDIAYAWHLFISDDKAELKYVKTDMNCDINKVLENPESEQFVDSWTVFLTDDGLEELMQLEMDDTLYKKMSELAEKFGMSVEDYCSKVLTDAYKSGMLQEFVDKYIESHKELKDEDKN